ncbi:glycosyltransferase family 2 protein [Novosphingobium beihaiensis]|uniref:Glycosyltransferase family 2 protein n=1 Tax=Novosphingobium beihaiensis TaxID=2930389 RepID=A0ABT0BL80_9SPHN|nr:glycosyltransferase family 2 protein [Novosphingobium beihaiensis]MCJ2185810.1 glycosyltransferase family 2 protein [Novosphingobium beihaiensis]
MLDQPPLRVGVVIPARDEAATVGRVVQGMRGLGRWDERVHVSVVIVCDNGSQDDTAGIAARAGALVVTEPEPGYGRACLAAIARLPAVDAVLFVDADGQFEPADARHLLGAVMDGADLVIGSRPAGRPDKHALSLPQRFGNWLATRMIRLFWNAEYSDLGPYRAIRADALARLDMRSRTFGWTVEMQVKAIQAGLVVAERAVSTRRRIGRSRISGTLRGVIMAGVGIIGTIVLLRVRERRFRKALFRQERRGRIAM